MSDETSERTVYVLEKNQREEIRAALSTYKGRPLASLRIWFDSDANDEDGQPIYRPSKKGITIARDKLPQLLAAVEGLIKAEQAA